MAGSGLFRVSLRGFNKDDVLKYIEQLKDESAKRCAESDSRRQDAESKVNAAIAKAEKAQEHSKQAQEQTNLMLQLTALR